MFKIYKMFEIFGPEQFQMKLCISIFQIHSSTGWDPVSLCWSTYFIQTLHIVSMAKHLWDLSANYSRVLSMSLHIQEYTSKTYFTNNIAEIDWSWPEFLLFFISTPKLHWLFSTLGYDLTTSCTSHLYTVGCLNMLSI